jgi:hypothetical protein
LAFLAWVLVRALDWLLALVLLVVAWLFFLSLSSFVSHCSNSHSNSREGGADGFDEEQEEGAKGGAESSDDEE